MAFLRELFKIADRQTRSAHRRAVLQHGTFDQLFEVVGDSGLVDAGGTEVQQNESTRAGVIAVVGKIRVGLNQAELKDLAQQQVKQQIHHAVAHGLRCVNQRFNRYASHVVHGQNVLGGQIGVQFGQRKRRCVDQQVAIALQETALLQVIGLIVQLALGVPQQRLDVHFLGQEPG